MHILAVLPPDRWMEINLLDSLREHYCEELHVFHYPGGMGQLGSALWRTKRDELNNALLTTARRLRAIGRLDLIFCVVYDDFLLVETAEQLQQLGVPMVNYHVDMAFQWYRAIRTAPYFDVLAVAQLTNTEHLRPYCQDIHWMPMAANPTFYYRPVMQPMTPDHSVTFVGSFNPFRRALLQECVRHGIRPVVFGRGWQLENPSPYEFHWDVHKVIHDLRYYAGARWKAEGYRSVVEDGIVESKSVVPRICSVGFGISKFPWPAGSIWSRRLRTIRSITRLVRKSLRGRTRATLSRKYGSMLAMRTPRRRFVTPDRGVPCKSTRGGIDSINSLIGYGA
jgi:hypothetical protein